MERSKTPKTSASEIDSLRLEKAKKCYQTGLVYEGMGDVEKAVKEWKKVLKIISDPQNSFHRKAKEKLRFYEK